MLGTRADAEDVLQESYLRWQSTSADEVRSPKSYLTTVVARLALDALKTARRKREVYVGPWLPEPLVDPNPSATLEISESLSIAFMHILEALSPAERAAFLLHEVFDAGYDEIAAALETTEANSRQLVSRARSHLRERRPRFMVDRVRHQAVLHRFLSACTNGDTSELVTVLKEDVTVYSDGGGKARAALNPIYGLDKTIRFILGLNRKWGQELSGGYFAEVNGEPGFVFTLDEKMASVLALDIDDDERIRAIYYVANPDKLAL